MKNLLPWLKAHWMIPVLLIVAIAVLPTAWWFADDMRTSDFTAYQDRVKKDYDSISDKTAAQAYYLAAMDGSGKVLEKSGVANEAMTKRYGEIWADVQSKVGGVSEKGSKFNQGDHKSLIDGLFPPPANDQVLTANLGRTFVEHDIQFHQQLLAKMKAGDAAKADDIARQLNDHRDAEVARVKAELNRELNAEETAKLTAELIAMRIGAVRKHAQEISVFADMSAFAGLPASVPETAPSPAQCWDWQECAWIDQDICTAITTANTHASAGVTDAVLKRVTKIAIAPAPWDPPQPAGYDAGDDKPPLDFSASVTGRVSGAGKKNKWYDVRTVTIEAIVSSQKLPEFLNALSATNFMSVLKLDLARVEPLADLREGFDYGDDNVVKATIVVETIWLRSWREAAMPPDVKAALGLDKNVQPDAASAGAAGSCPQRSSRRRRRAHEPRPPRTSPGQRRQLIRREPPLSALPATLTPPSPPAAKETDHASQGN